MPINSEASVLCVINSETQKSLDSQDGIRAELRLGLGGTVLD